MSSIGVYSNTDKCDERRENDFYPTPWQATEALLLKEVEFLKHHETIWEPACGDGAMSKIIKMHGYQTISTDLVYRGYSGSCEIDFLKSDIQLSRAIITNPPFDLAEGFIRHAWDMGVDYIALLLKSNYFHADCRVSLFNERHPSRIYPLAWRVDFTGGGANHFDCMWVVWDAHNWANQPCFYMPPLERPDIMGQRSMI